MSRIPVLVAALATACSEPAPTTTVAQPLTTEGEAVVVGTPWRFSTITVCWTAGGNVMGSAAAGALSADLDALEATIHTAWEPTVGVHWVFSRDCLSDFDVALDVEGNQSLGLGRTLREPPPLGLDLAVRPDEEPASRHARVRDEALLASGRILGLEWYPADETATCQSPFRRGCSDQSPLLPTTVLAATALYGNASGVYIDPAGQCLQVRQPFQTWKPAFPMVQDCGTPSPLRQLTTWRGYLLRSDQYGCLRAGSGSLSFIDCAPSSTLDVLQWEMANERALTSIGARCVTMPRGEGDAASYRNCDGAPDQEWSTSDGMIIHGVEPVMCLAPARVGGIPEPSGTPVVVETCARDANTASRQQWDWATGGALVNRLSHHCLTIPDGGGEDGAPLTSETCQGSTNQRFTKSGEVYTGYYNPRWLFFGAPPASATPTVLPIEPYRSDVDHRYRWWSYVP